MTVDSKHNKNEVIFLAVGIVVYIVLRTIFLHQFQNSAFWDNLTIDTKFHYQWAQSIANGNIWGNEPYFRAPLYAYFLSLFYAVFSGKILGMVIIQHVIGLISFVLVFKLSKEIFGRWPAYITAFLYIFAFDLIYFESELLLDFLLVFFLPLIFILIFKADRSEKKISWLMAGLITGLAAITRPTVLILLVIIPLFYLNAKSKFFSYKKWFLNSLFFVIGIIILLVPVAIRNSAVGGEFTPLPSQGGINFYIGNNLSSNGWSAAMPPPLSANWQYADCKFQAEQESGRKLTSSEISDFWLIKGLEFWIDNPNETIQLYLKKLYLLIYNDDISNNKNIEEIKKHIPVSNLLIISWWLIIPFGLLGIVQGIKRNSKARLILMFMTFYSLLMLLFFITSRFKLVLLPFWIIFASFGIYKFVIDIRFKKYLLSVLKIIIIIPLMTLSLGVFYKIPLSDKAQQLFSEANSLFIQDKYYEARVIFQKLAYSDPPYPQANMNLAATFVKTKDLDSADHYYLRELKFNADSAEVFSSRAEIARLIGNPETAYNLARQAFTIKPYFTEIMLNYVKAGRAYTRQDESLNNINPVEDYYKSNPYYYFYRGVLKIDLAAQDLRYLSSAETDFLQAISILSEGFQPDYERNPTIFELFFSAEKQESLLAQSYANLGVININRNDPAAAYNLFNKALEYDSSLSPAGQGLVEAAMRLGKFEEALEFLDNLIPTLNPETEVQYLLYKAQAYYNLGKVDSSITILQEIIERYPDYHPAHRVLEAIKKGG